MSAADKIRLACPECGKALSVGAHLVGKQVKCPGCGARIAVPSPQARAEAGAGGRDVDQAKPRGQPSPVEPTRKTAIEDRAGGYGKAILSLFHLFWVVAMALLMLGLSTSMGDAAQEPLGRVFLPMAGLTAVIALGYAIACSPVSYSLGTLLAAAAGFLAALVPAGLGWLSVQVAGVVGGMILYGAVLGSVIWNLLFWVRRWPWAQTWSLGAKALGGQGGLIVSKEMLEGKASCAELVRYVTPSGAKFSGLLVVTETEVVFQTQLPPGQAPVGMEPVLAVNFSLDFGSILLASDRLAVTIRKDQIARLVADKGPFFHRLILTTADGRSHQVRCGLFPCPKLFEAIRDGLPATVFSGLTWQGYAPKVCRGEVSGIEPPYFLLCCETLPKAEALVNCRAPGLGQRLRGKPRVIPFADGRAASYLPLRSAKDAKPYLEELFRDDSVGTTVLSGGLCAGLSEEDNRAVLATVGLSRACTHGATLILG